MLFFKLHVSSYIRVQVFQSISLVQLSFCSHVLTFAIFGECFKTVTGIVISSSSA